MHAADPPSPCISICHINDDGLCEGCLRTLDEIAAWGSSPGEEKHAIMARVASRRDNQFSQTPSVKRKP